MSTDGMHCTMAKSESASKKKKKKKKELYSYVIMLIRLSRLFKCSFQPRI